MVVEIIYGTCFLRSTSQHNEVFCVVQPHPRNQTRNKICFLKLLEGGGGRVGVQTLRLALADCECP